MCVCLCVCVCVSRTKPQQSGTLYTHTYICTCGCQSRYMSLKRLSTNWKVQPKLTDIEGSRCSLWRRFLRTWRKVKVFHPLPLVTRDKSLKNITRTIFKVLIRALYSFFRKWKCMWRTRILVDDIINEWIFIWIAFCTKVHLLGFIVIW